jgi:hypothetical protein
MWITQVLVLHGVIFGVCTLLLWFSGNNHVLAGSKRSGIKDVAKLNRWAGNRFLILTVVACTMARLSIGNVGAGILGFMFLWAALAGVIIWISVGGKKF